MSDRHTPAQTKGSDLVLPMCVCPAILPVRKSRDGRVISLTDAEFSTQISNPTPSSDISKEVGVYHDLVGDFVTNEPANDYTAKFLLLLAFYLSS